MEATDRAGKTMNRDAGKGYKTILIDPPWQYGKWLKASRPRSKNHIPKDSGQPYKTMKVKEIRGLDIKALAAKNCELYCWTTQKYLPEVFGIIKGWGFKYCQMLTWIKNPMGTGQGGAYTATTEFLVLARRGRMPTGFKRVDRTHWQVKRTNKHSQKPNFFHELIEQNTLPPRMEIFARKKHPGWDAIGEEIDGADVRAAIEYIKILREGA